MTTEHELQITETFFWQKTASGFVLLVVAVVAVVVVVVAVAVFGYLHSDLTDKIDLHQNM